MALSDEERKRLQKLEQELDATDPDTDRQLQAGLSRNWASPRIIYGALAALAGFALVVGGIITHLAVIAVAGFLLMFAGNQLLSHGLSHGGRDREGLS